MGATSGVAFVSGVEAPDANADLAAESILFAFRGADLLVVVAGSENGARLPNVGDPGFEALPVVRRQFLGHLGGAACWSTELAADAEAPAGMRFAGLRALYGPLPEPLFALAGRAAQIVAWERDHQFCGRCGTPTEPAPGERARRCPACRLTAFPRLSPAVIVLIERGDRILLARGPQFPMGRFGIVAGFVEPGESLEEAVRREIREEVGIEVDEPAYFGSQPWPFPHQIMIGFTARHASGEIAIDPAELAEAGWYGIDELPQIPQKLSIARRLIDDWAARRGRVLSEETDWP